MARAIVYSIKPSKHAPSAGSPITFGGPATNRTEKGTQRVEEAAARDDYTGKLVKYVPA